MTPEQIAKGLSALEREWITGWQGPAGAAFNVIAGDLYSKGLLKGRMDWNLNATGRVVKAILEAAMTDPTFDTLEALEAWAAKQKSKIMADMILGVADYATPLINQVTRVRAARSHLKGNDDE